MLTRDNNYPEHVPFYIILMKNSLANNANSYSRVTNVQIENVSYSFEEKKRNSNEILYFEKTFSTNVAIVIGMENWHGFPHDTSRYYSSVIITLTRVRIEIRSNSQKRARTPIQRTASRFVTTFRDKSAYSNVPPASNLTIRAAVGGIFDRETSTPTLFPPRDP